MDKMKDNAVEKPSSKEVPNAKTPYFGSVRFFKNLILLVVIVAIAVPTTMTVILGQKVEAALLSIEQLEAEKQYLEATLAYEFAQPEPPTVPDQHEEMFAANILSEPIYYQELYPDFYAEKSGSSTVCKENVIYLTFDDGPSALTPEILKVLREKGVKATFFVTGNETEQGKQWMRDIVADGHTLGMHSYSHDLEQIYSSVEAYLEDMYQIYCLIREATGEAPIVFRFPGGSVNSYNQGIYQEIIAEMLRRGFVPYDWNISSQDTVGGVRFAREITDNVVSQADKVSRGIVLLHDVDTNQTMVEALPSMIQQIQENGFAVERLTCEVMPFLYDYPE